MSQIISFNNYVATTNSNIVIPNVTAQTEVLDSTPKAHINPFENRRVPWSGIGNDIRSASCVDEAIAKYNKQKYHPQGNINETDNKVKESDNKVKNSTKNINPETRNEAKEEIPSHVGHADEGCDLSGAGTSDGWASDHPSDVATIG